MDELLANPIVWGTAAAIVVLALLAWRLRSRRPNEGPQLNNKLVESNRPTRDLSDYFEVPQAKADDRRHQLRRDGKPVPIHFRLSDVSPAQLAVVLDRNKDGLRLALEQSLSIGASLSLMADHAPPGTPWTQAKVTWCKPVEGRYELGCQFVEELPWNVVLLFG